MPEFLNAIQTSDQYVAATTLGPARGVARINLNVIPAAGSTVANPVLLTFWKYRSKADGTFDYASDAIKEGFERLVVGNTIGAIARGAAGVEVRNAIAGQPATIIAELVYGQGAVIGPDIDLDAGSVSSAIIGPNGQTGGGVTNIKPTPLASFPPATPSDGDLCVLELPSTYDPVGGKKIRWLCSFNAGDGVWDVVGPAAPLYAEVQTSEAVPGAQVAYGDITTVGPTQTTPRPGDYMMEVGLACSAPPSNALGAIAMAYAIGAVGAADADAAVIYPGASTNQNGAVIGSPRAREKAGLLGSQSVVAKYRISGGNVAISVANRWLRMTPIRLT